MKELEVKTYNFAIQAIGFAKSIEKKFPEISISEFKKSAGAVSIIFIDAFDAQENSDFAKNLRQCHNKIIESIDGLNSIEPISDETLEKQRLSLIKEAILIDEKLETIIQKLIF